jgi:signal transduction histidine kinase
MTKFLVSGCSTLSITRGIVERHGGRITIESKKGKGTDETIICPAGKGTD